MLLWSLVHPVLLTATAMSIYYEQFEFNYKNLIITKNILNRIQGIIINGDLFVLNLSINQLVDTNRRLRQV